MLKRKTDEADGSAPKRLCANSVAEATNSSSSADATPSAAAIPAGARDAAVTTSAAAITSTPAAASSVSSSMTALSGLIARHQVLPSDLMWWTMNQQLLAANAEQHQQLLMVTAKNYELCVQLEQAKQDLQKQQKDAQILGAEQEKLTEKAKLLNADLQASKAELSQVKAKLEKRKAVAALAREQTKVSNLIEAYQKKYQEAADLKIENQQLQDQVAQLTGEKSQLTADMKVVSEELQQAKAQLEAGNLRAAETVLMLPVGVSASPAVGAQRSPVLAPTQNGERFSPTSFLRLG